MTVRDVFSRIREDDLSHDPWGTSLSWHFAVCDVMTEWAPPYPDAEWGYRQASGGVDAEDYRYQELTAMMEAGELDSDDLLYVGRVLHRYEELLRRKGEDY